MTPQRALHPSLAVRLFGRDPEHRLALLRAAWPLAVGPELARRTHVLTATGATLRVRVPDAAWRKVLHAMQGTLRARLRAIVGELAPTRLAFQEIPAGDAPHDSAAAAPRAEPPVAPESVQHSARAIADPELRRRFLLSAAQALASGRSRPVQRGSASPSGDRT